MTSPGYRARLTNVECQRVKSAGDEMQPTGSLFDSGRESIGCEELVEVEDVYPLSRTILV